MKFEQANKHTVQCMGQGTDYGRPERKQSSLQGQQFTLTPKFLGTGEPYLVCHISPNFQIFLIHAFIWCPSSVDGYTERCVRYYRHYTTHAKPVKFHIVVLVAVVSMPIPECNLFFILFHTGANFFLHTVVIR